MKLSLAITTHNRDSMTIESFKNVICDSRIDEVVIVDDHSDGDYYSNIIGMLSKLECKKVKLYRNDYNIGMSRNKLKAIKYCQNDYVIIFDSDNVMDKDYLDAFEKQVHLFHFPWVGNINNTTIFCPDFAMPEFNYTKYAGKLINHETAHNFIDEPEFSCFLNTCNYIVPREKYLEVWRQNLEIKATDTIWFNYLWLSQGYSFFIVPEMRYKHRVHPDSGFLKDIDYNMKKSQEIKEMIRLL